MVTIKLTDVSVKFGNKFRKRQNYTMWFSATKDGVTKNTSVNELMKIIAERYTHEVTLNKQSKIEII